MKQNNDIENITWLVSSVINFTPKELSYTSIRSIYNPQQRENQTLKTIESIRKYAPNSRIILLEIGQSEKHLEKIKQEVDEYIFLGCHPLVKMAVNSKYKGLGEAVGLYFGLRKLNIKLGFLFKISGRYSLNNQFCLNDWDKEKINLKYYGNSMSTRLYGFPTDYLLIYKRALLKSFFSLSLGNSIEDILVRKLPKSLIVQLETLGVEGNVGPDGFSLLE